MIGWENIFKQIQTDDLNINPFKLIGDEWFLLTAGNRNSFNTMTASWGTMGEFWNKPVAICFIRPNRHTYEFAEESDVFSLSFVGNENKDILRFCGSKSGRDTDKIKETGLKPVILKNEGVSFEQAHLVIECRKIYFDDIKPVFIIPDNIDDSIYPNKDYHRMYIGEVIGVYKK
ncbi:MAG: flavin reductase family protein [Bacteroidales bacterium]|nr:flavin reductase family protein [Bacteroidales bacterium]MBN2819349.1 flavin reductase family protein [Bacteroidales bacterium]